jgi:serine phosphatase RsbU (regulator of sigma subunit)
VAAHLDRGDALVLYTDGVTEAIGAGGEMFGEARLRDAISAGGSAQQMAEGIVTRLGAWRAVLADDVTLVVAKRS